jgi:hypothetical protein
VVAVHGLGTGSFFGPLGSKNVPVPLAAKGDSPIFDGQPLLRSGARAKIGTVPRERLPECRPAGKGVTYMHLIAEGLVARRHAQRSLFDRPDPRQKAVAAVKRMINERVGRFAVRSAATLPLAEVYRDEAKSYDICDIYGKTCF